MGKALDRQRLRTDRTSTVGHRRPLSQTCALNLEVLRSHPAPPAPPSPVSPRALPPFGVRSAAAAL